MCRLGAKEVNDGREAKRMGLSCVLHISPVKKGNTCSSYFTGDGTWALENQMTSMVWKQPSYSQQRNSEHYHQQRSVEEVSSLGEKEVFAAFNVLGRGYSLPTRGVTVTLCWCVKASFWGPMLATELVTGYGSLRLGCMCIHRTSGS